MILVKVDTNYQQSQWSVLWTPLGSEDALWPGVQSKPWGTCTLCQYQLQYTDLTDRCNAQFLHEAQSFTSDCMKVLLYNWTSIYEHCVIGQWILIPCYYSQVQMLFPWFTTALIHHVIAYDHVFLLCSCSSLWIWFITHLFACLCLFLCVHLFLCCV